MNFFIRGAISLPTTTTFKHSYNSLNINKFTIIVDNFMSHNNQKVGKNAIWWEKMHYFYTVKLKIGK